jgi:hypothetical protein
MAGRLVNDDFQNIFFTQLLPAVFLDYQRNRKNSLKTRQYTVFSSHFSYKYRPNIVIIRLVTGKGQISIQLDVRWTVHHCDN